MKIKCDICNCEHGTDRLHRTGILHLKGSEDDYICERCRLELSRFARSMQCIADKVRWNETEKNKITERMER